MSSVFMATLSVLTYRLLFHSDRVLTLASLILCVLSSYCISQLIDIFLMNTTSADDYHWLRALEGPRVMIASSLKPLCFYSGVSEELRLKCGQLIDLLHTNSSCEST